MIIDDTYRLLQITYWATYSVEKNDVYSRFELERENNEPYESYYKVARLVNYLQPVCFVQDIHNNNGVFNSKEDPVTHNNKVGKM